VHTAPQAPQLLASVLVSVHVLEQRSFWEVGHWHRPFLHTWPVRGEVDEHTSHCISKLVANQQGVVAKKLHTLYICTCLASRQDWHCWCTSWETG
jgi:hypothetical protein